MKKFKFIFFLSVLVFNIKAFDFSKYNPFRDDTMEKLKDERFFREEVNKIIEETKDGKFSEEDLKNLRKLCFKKKILFAPGSRVLDNFIYNSNLNQDMKNDFIDLERVLGVDIRNYYFKSIFYFYGVAFIFCIIKALQEKLKKNNKEKENYFYFNENI